MENLTGKQKSLVECARIFMNTAIDASDSSKQIDLDAITQQCVSNGHEPGVISSLLKMSLDEVVYYMCGCDDDLTEQYILGVQERMANIMPGSEPSK